MVKNTPANAGVARNTGSLCGLGRSLAVGNGNHSIILAWKIPWTEEPGGLQSMKQHSDMTEWEHTHTHTHTHRWCTVLQIYRKLIHIYILFQILLHYACMLCHFSCFPFSLTSWTAAHQTPQSMEFSRQEHWGGLPFHSASPTIGYYKILNIVPILYNGWLFILYIVVCIC